MNGAPLRSSLDQGEIATDAPIKRWPTAALVVIVLAAFGPYVAPGIRTEQIAVYGMFAVLCAGLWASCVRPNSYGVLVLACWLLIAGAATVSAISPPFNSTRYMSGSAFAGLDNLTLPITVMLIAWMLIGAGANRQELIRTICLLTVWAMVANAILAIWSFAGNDLDLSDFYNFDDSLSVSDLAVTMGRYSGAINQPAEAGLLYSVALIAAVFLYREQATLLAVIMTALAVGGVLTVSKIFLLIGLPVGIWQALRASGKRQRRYTAIFCAIISAYALVQSGVLPAWAGQGFLFRLLPGNGQDAVTLYTAGRFGDNSTLAEISGDVLRLAPAFGFGGQGLRVPYDNAWVEALVVNGILGAVTYSAVLLLVIAGWAQTRKLVGREESRLSGGLVVIIVSASSGVPALTANRCATVVWLLITLLLLSQLSGEKGTKQN